MFNIASSIEKGGGEIMKRIWIITLFAVLMIVMAFTSAHAETMKDAISNLVTDHNRIQAAQARLDAANQRARVSLGKWFPQADVRSYYGKERKENADNTFTNMSAQELDVQITQLLWDFGETNADLREAKLLREQAKALLEATRQEIILEGVVAYLNLKRAENVLEYAKQSEDNIKRQAEMEDTRVRKGQGYSTDVLQAKTQLLGTQARRIRSEGELARARTRVETVFNRPWYDISALEMLVTPFGLLPTTLEEAEKAALEGNWRLKASDLNVQMTMERVVGNKAREFFPKINAVVEGRYMDDVNGIIDYRDEKIAKVELTFPFNLGFTSVNSVKATRKDHEAAVEQDRDNRDLIVEDANNAWDNLNTARGNAELLRDQADIVSEFLELARKEQQMGRRSLLDVLSGETSLINAQSDAAAAEADIAISAFTLLQIIGELDIDVF
jgi:adhesin transport system outer membrane protein